MPIVKRRKTGKVNPDETKQLFEPGELVKIQKPVKKLKIKKKSERVTDNRRAQMLSNAVAGFSYAWGKSRNNGQVYGIRLLEAMDHALSFLTDEAPISKKLTRGELTELYHSLDKTIPVHK